MSEMKKLCENLKIKATEDQLVAGKYLESRGKRFGVDFGVKNAESLADELFDSEVSWPTLKA